MVHYGIDTLVYCIWLLYHHYTKSSLSTGLVCSVWQHFSCLAVWQELESVTRIKCDTDIRQVDLPVSRLWLQPLEVTADDWELQSVTLPPTNGVFGSSFLQRFLLSGQNNAEVHTPLASETHTGRIVVLWVSGLRWCASVLRSPSSYVSYPPWPAHQLSSSNR